MATIFGVSPGSLVLLAIISLALHRLWIAFYNLFLSPLSSFPGPKLWAISRIPWQLSVIRGQPHVDMAAMHQRYGPVVRVGPNELMFNTAEAFRDIYSTRAFRKDRTHYPPTINGLDNIITAVDDAVHARHRKLLTHAFSERALRAQEPIIRGHVTSLMRILEEKVWKSRGGLAEIDAGMWLNSMAFDITGDLMFGETFGCLENGQLNPWIRIIFESVKLYAIIAVFDQFPWLRFILHAITPESAKQKVVDHFNLGVTKVGKRLELGAERPDFMSAFMRNGLTEKGDLPDAGSNDAEGVGSISREELDANAFLLIVAGSETVATALTGCIYFLCRTPRALDRLVTEIRTAFSSTDDISFATTSRLPYLKAVLEEALRIYPPFVTSNVRLTPPGGCTISGYPVTGNVKVSCPHYASYHSESNFHLPDEFVPERWLEGEQADPRFAADRKDALQPFSLGPRNCIGKTLAYAEMRLTLCHFLWRFDIALCTGLGDWANQKVFYFWDKDPLMISVRK